MPSFSSWYHVGQSAHLRTRSQGCRPQPPPHPLAFTWGVTAQRCQPAPHVEARPCALGSQQAPPNQPPAESSCRPAACSLPAPVPITARRPRVILSQLPVPDSREQAGVSGRSGGWACPRLPGKDLARARCPSGWLSGVWTGHTSCSASATEATSVLTFPWCFTRPGPSPQPAAALGRQRAFLQASAYFPSKAFCNDPFSKYCALFH